MPIAVWTMSVGGQECQTTSNYEAPTLSLDQASDALAEFWREGLGKSLSNLCTLTNVKVETTPFPKTGTGGITQACESAASAVIVNKINAGKPGRFFLPGLPQDAVEPAATLLTSWVNTYVIQLNNALAQLEIDGVTLRVQGSSSIREVTALTVSPVIGLQGRRRFGR